MSKRGFWFTLIPAVVVVPMVVGCGTKEPERFAVTGEVSVKGRPIDGGFIEFWPQDGQGSMDGAMIENGQYEISKSKGLFPGKYKIAIIGGGASGEGDASPDAKMRPSDGPQIPPQYGSESEIVVEVTRDGPNQFDFKIP
jgi:hypothetical protein